MMGGDRGDMQIKELVPGIIHQGVAPDISQHATSACIMRHSWNLICSGLRPDPISDPTTVAQNVYQLAAVKIWTSSNQFSNVDRATCNKQPAGEAQGGKQTLHNSLSGCVVWIWSVAVRLTSVFFPLLNVFIWQTRGGRVVWVWSPLLVEDVTKAAESLRPVARFYSEVF